MSEELESNAAPADGSAREVLSNITEAVFALDDERRVTYANEAAGRVLDADEGELHGTVVWDALPGSVESTFRRECERATATGRPATFEAFHPRLDGWFEVRVHPSETGLSVCCRDVTGRVDRQEPIEKRERALRRAYDVVADPDLSFREQIDALLTVVREAVETDFATFSRVHPEADTYVFEAVDVPDDIDLEPGFSVPLEELPVCAEVVAAERTLVLPDVEEEAPELADPTWGIACYLGTPVLLDDEAYGTFCFYGMEPTDEAFADWQVTLVELLSNWVSTELARQRENDRLETFASMLAHELRNPLNIAQLYHGRAADGDSEAAAEVADALDRIDEIVDVMLVTARSTDSVIDCEPVDLADAATEAAAGALPDGAELAVETDRVVEVDPIHLRHLLENLFRNAVEHGSTSPRSQAREDVHQTSTDAARQNPADSDDAVEHGSTSSRPEADDSEERAGPGVTVRIGDHPGGFFVADDGPGISDAERMQVFDAGYTTDASGIGLGLTFVDRLADTYGWDCRVAESEAGGARFEFTGVGLANEE